MNLIFVVNILWSFLSISGKDLPVIMYEDNVDGDQLVIKADNKSFRPYTVEVEMLLEGMTSSASNKFYFVIEGKQKQLTVTNLTPTTQRYSYQYRFMCYPGDWKSAKHDDDFVYRLPFKSGFNTKVTQGYDGVFSHKKKKALDFLAPNNTEIFAARGGIVVEIKEDSNKGCSSIKCIEDANYLRILHDDGTESGYSHLSYNGVLVELGEVVKSGDLIALSGNTGWTTNPHLHFEVIQPILKKEKTVKTLFKLSNENKYLLKGMIIKC